MARVRFAESGFHVTSMNEIAEAAGVTKPVLYQHFPSKRALYLELLDDVGSQLIDHITRATARAGSQREQVRFGFEAYFEYVQRDRSSFRLLFGGGTRRDPEFARAVMRVEDAIAAVIAELIDVRGLDRDRRVLLALGLVGMAEATSRHWMTSGLEGDVADLAHQVADLAWSGLRGVSAG